MRTVVGGQLRGAPPQPALALGFATAAQAQIPDGRELRRSPHGGFASQENRRTPRCCSRCRTPAASRTGRRGAEAQHGSGSCLLPAMAPRTSVYFTAALPDLQARGARRERANPSLCAALAVRLTVASSYMEPADPGWLSRKLRSSRWALVWRRKRSSSRPGRSQSAAVSSSISSARLTDRAVGWAAQRVR
jgi:hypothetical protein